MLATATTVGGRIKEAAGAVAGAAPAGDDAAGAPLSATPTEGDAAGAPLGAAPAEGDAAGAPRTTAAAGVGGDAVGMECRRAEQARSTRVLRESKWGRIASAR